MTRAVINLHQKAKVKVQASKAKAKKPAGKKVVEASDASRDDPASGGTLGAPCR